MKIVWLGNEQMVSDKYAEQENEFLIMNRDNFSMKKLEEFKPEIVIEREFNDGKSIYEFEMTYLEREHPEIKRAVWLIDTHVQFQRHFVYAKHFDFIFMAISRYVPIFQNEFKKAKVFWLPVCHPTACLPPNTLIGRPHKVSFVGRWGQTLYTERTELVEKLKQNKWFYAKTDYETPYQTMSSSEITFNRSFSEDMNYRVFEALACGTELVTNLVPDLLKIKGLKDRIHIYKRDGDAIEIVKDLVEGRKKYKGTPETHRNWIRESHLLKHRVTDCIKMIQFGIQCDY